MTGGILVAARTSGQRDKQEEEREEEERETETIVKAC